MEGAIANLKMRIVFDEERFLVFDDLEWLALAMP